MSPAKAKTTPKKTAPKKRSPSKARYPVDEAPPPYDLITIKDVIVSMRTYLPNLSEDSEKMVRKAFRYAKKAHEGQMRKSGEEYINHPLHTAYILTQIRLDPDSVMAALLHDVVEDTPHTLKDIEKNFGARISALVSGLVKVGQVRYYGEDQQIDNLRKMFMAMASDMRVIFIKLADRLHNMQTLEAVAPNKQWRIAKETLEVYAPLADRLGIFQIKWQLEDICFQYIYPEEYEQLATIIQQDREELERYIALVRGALEKMMKENKIEVKVRGRVKHLYSIYRKMTSRNKSLSEIYDRVALRLVVSDVKTCYQALGVIHSEWKPVPRRFKDYIAVPKINGYRSLHTTIYPTRSSVFQGKFRRPVEIQIRTAQMDGEAEYGAAAHWVYNENKQSIILPDRQMDWIKSLAELQEEFASNQELVDQLKLDVFSDRIFCFTPFGDVKDLPFGATPVDFAYAVHTQLGHRCKGARVDGVIRPLSYQLCNGETVEIITKDTFGPSHYWLSFVKTSHARSSIKSWLKEQDKEKNVQTGREILNKELIRLGKDPLPVKPKKDVVGRLIKNTSYKHIDDVFAAIGDGSLNTSYAVRRLYEREDILQLTPDDQQPVEVKKSPKKKSLPGEIIIGGETDLKYEIKHCCSPRRGDRIIGYITKNKGVAIHRVGCSKLKRCSAERLINCEWQDVLVDQYKVKLVIIGHDRRGMMLDVTERITNSGVNIVGVRTGPLPDSAGQEGMAFTIEVDSVSTLTKIMDDVEQIDGVVSVSSESFSEEKK